MDRYQPQHHAPPNTIPVQNGWPDRLLALFHVAQNDPSGSLNFFDGPFTTMFKAHCFPEDKYIVAPEVPQFSVAPETKSLYLRIDLVVQALTAKKSFLSPCLLFKSGRAKLMTLVVIALMP